MGYGIDLEVVGNIEVRGRRVGDYFIDGDTLIYSLPYPRPTAFAVVNLDKILVTPWMLKLPSFLKYHNIDWLRQQLMQVKCVQRDAVLLHGACWVKDDVGYLAVGFPNSGKTTRVLIEAAKGAELCADENVVVEGDWAYSVPRRSSVNRWHIEQFGLPTTLSEKAWLKFAELRARLCPLYEPNIWYELRKTIFPGVRIDKLIYLTKPNCAEPLALLTDNEFPFYTNPVIQTWAYATGFDLDDVYANYRKVLRKIGGWV